MAISDTQYLTWLQNDTARRVTLVEATGYNGTSVTTFYFSNYSFASTPSDTPANTIYDDLLREIPRISNSMSEVFGGQSKPALGDIVVDNCSGERDAWLTYAWIGYPIKIYLGDISWPKSDFRQIVDGIIADLQVKSSSELTFKIRDKQDLLNKQVQSNLYTTGANIDKPIPLCFGEVYQVIPVLVDSTTHAYQVHDGQIEDILNVYVDGISVSFTKDLPNGKFTLSSASTGTVTCDVKGAKPSGTYLTKIGDIIQYLAIKAGLSSGDIDSASLSNFNTTCPYTVGMFIGDRVNLLQVCDELVKSVGGWYGFGRNGKLKLGRLDAPTGTATLELIADDIEGFGSNGSTGVDVVTIYQPIKTYRLGYRKHYMVWTSGLNSAVSETVRADLIQQYRAVSSANSVPYWPLAEEPAMMPTLITNQTDAQTECNRRASLSSVPRKIIKVRAFTAPQTIEIGQEVKITYPRYGLSGGVNGIVTSVSESPTSNRVELQIWL